ncbi:MAG TPA: ubiquinol-cytochrome c reductase iron-sulfur subunit, partial [Acidimicrobiia bacterium]|nr:ubiquinol-cytochrome c reductase iron-sulfur subunit [Acidimicrobiia bacterium]
MTFTNWILVAVAVFAILGAVGAFTIAFRRTRAERPDPTAGVSPETRRADRSMSGVRVDMPATDAEDSGDADTTAPEDEEPEEAEELEEEPELVSAGAAIDVIETQRVVEVTPEESGVSRRQFFNRAIGATFGLFLGLQGVYYLAFFWPKLSGGFGSDVDAGAIDDLAAQTVNPDGSIVPVFVPEARAYVVPAPDTLSDQYEGRDVAAGGLMAIFQRCVHLGCRVPWCATSIGFECPCHGSRYNSIGEYFSGPAPRNLDRFVVEVRNEDRFIIRTGQPVVETSRAPRPSVNYPQGPT